MAGCLEIPQSERPLVEIGGRFRFNTTLLDLTASGMGPEDWRAALGAGGPPVEILGHLVATRLQLLRTLGVGVDELPDPDEWTRPDELIGTFRGSDRPLVRALTEVTEEEAGAERAGARLDPAVPLTLEACVGFFYFDEVFHLGQLNLVRRQLGKQPAV